LRKKLLNVAKQKDLENMLAKINEKKIMRRDPKTPTKNSMGTLERKINK